MRVVAEEQWFWTLFESDDRRFLSVLCSAGGAGYTDVTIELDPTETATYRRDGPDFLQTLATTIQNERHSYRNREIPGFNTDPAVLAALSRWRS